MIAAGRIVAEGAPGSLAGRDLATSRVRFRLPDGVTPPLDLPGARLLGGFTEFSTDDPVHVLHGLLGWAIDAGVTLEGLEVTRPSLEDVYLQLTGGTGGGEAAEPAPAGRGRRSR